MCPPVHGGWIRQSCRVFALRRCLLSSITSGEVITRLLPTVQAERRRWRQPIGQDREALPAWLADPPPHPDGFVLIVVVLTQSPPVANDRVITANRASPREKVQRDHPGSALSSASGSAIKRITAGVRAAADRRCQVSIWRLAFTLPVKSVQTKKEYCFLVVAVPRTRPRLETMHIGGYQQPVDST